MEREFTVIESSLAELYQSAVDAFPHTTKRQHVTDSVKIAQLDWMPYLGMKTLFIRGRAVNEGRQYKTIILFKNVIYTNEANGDLAFVANDGKQYFIKRLSEENTQVLVRCDCPDFHWRFNYFDYLDDSLHGRKRKKYEGKGGPPANPAELPGMCKHLMKTAMALKDANLI